MKRILTIVIISSCFYAEAQDYQVFPDSMATWTNADVNFFWGDVGPSSYYIALAKFSMTNQDTVINSLSYSNIYYDDSLYVGGTRLDSSRVYFVLQGDSVEHLLYDFGAQIGDTIFNVFYTNDGSELHDDDYYELANYTVSNIDSILCADGILRKRLHLWDYYSGAEHEWVEGIGDLGGLFWWAGPNVSDYFVDLARLCINNQMVFLNTETVIFLQDSSQVCQSDFTTGVSELSPTSFEIHPNPATDRLYIKSGVIGEIADFQIFNLKGQKVLSGKLNLDASSSVDLSSLNSGLYVFSLIVSSNRYSKRLIIE